MTLPQRYLSKKGGRWRPLRVMDVAVLLYHVWRGAQEPEVGFEDAGNTLDGLTKSLNKKVFVPPGLLESCLWSCNLLDERGQFWHPRGLTFEQFASSVLGRDRFNRTYNWIETAEERKSK
jgi:hypothetical protein